MRLSLLMRRLLLLGRSCARHCWRGLGLCLGHGLRRARRCLAIAALRLAAGLAAKRRSAGRYAVAMRALVRFAAIMGAPLMRMLLLGLHARACRLALAALDHR